MAWNRVLVVFSGRADLWWLRLLRPGFRHCFLALGDGHMWMTFEPLSHRTEIIVAPLPPDFDLGAWYRRQGMVVVESTIRQPPRRPAPWRPFTCVEAVKRVLGLRAPWVLTPWQLYRHLGREN